VKTVANTLWRQDVDVVLLWYVLPISANRVRTTVLWSLSIVPQTPCAHESNNELWRKTREFRGGPSAAHDDWPISGLAPHHHIN
jgi:hypothetical protein